MEYPLSSVLRYCKINILQLYLPAAGFYRLLDWRSLVELGFYYLSRFKRHVTLAIGLCVAKLTLMQLFIYQYNAGVDGNIFLLSAISSLPDPTHHTHQARSFVGIGQ